MFEINQKAKMTERALPIGAFTEAANEAHAQSLLEELEELVATLGIPVVERKLSGSILLGCNIRCRTSLERGVISGNRAKGSWGRI